jgi:membrane protease YdiL (CAAX protease family)
MNLHLPEKALQTVLRVGVYVFLVFAGVVLFGTMLYWAFGNPIAAMLGTFAAGALANAVAMRIYEDRSLVEIGLGWSAASVRNLLLGLAGGMVAALIVVLGPILEGVAELAPVPGQRADWGAILLLLVLVVFGAMGEEMIFRGYGFQVLMGALGPFTTILPVSVLFAFLHAGNPNVTLLGLVNTALWGVLLGYAFYRSGDLWLPIGLHVGWNWMLPLLGTNLSGFKMNVTGYAMHWNVAPLWSGGDYGPEGSLSTSLVVLLLFLWLVVKAPVRRQRPFLLRERWEEE